MPRALIATAALLLACSRASGAADPGAMVPHTGSGGRAGSGGVVGGTDAAAVGGGGGATGGADAASSADGRGGSAGGAAGDAAAAGGASGDAGDALAGGAGGDAAGPALANPFVYVGSSVASEIRIFELNLQTGGLLPRGSAPSGPSPGYLAFHPSGKYLYAINEGAVGRVVAFAVNPSTGALTTLNTASSGGNGAAHLSVHKSGNWVLVANYASGHVAALPILLDGKVGAPVAPRFAGAQAHMILDDGVTGNFVFVPSKGDDRTLQFKFDATTGRLEPNTPAFVEQAGSPRHMVFDRAGRNAYLLTEAGLSVISYKYDSTTGLLSAGVRLAAAPAGDGAHILLHPTRDILYASIRFYDALAIFNLDDEGRAQPPRHVRQMIARPWDFAIDPSAQYMLVANNDTARVQVFRIAQADGGLTPLGGAAVTERPRFVGILARPR